MNAICTCTVCNREYIGHFNSNVCGDDCRRQFKRAYEKAYRASRKTTQPEPQFEPFPPEVDRDEFGPWLSGFSAGEAMFALRFGTLKDRAKPRPQQFASFRIQLRDDDADVLRLIQSYWACGSLSFQPNSRFRLTNAKPIVAYSVQRISDLMRTVIPHFDRYPLQAKKRDDFAIWKRGVMLMSEIQSRPQVGRLLEGGIMPRWTNADREIFVSLCRELASQRSYPA